MNRKRVLGSTGTSGRKVEDTAERPASGWGTEGGANKKRMWR